MDRKMIIEVDGVSKNFGATQALKDVSITVREGTIHALLGRNGAGKSTLVNIIAGVYPASSGRVLFKGEDIKDLNIFERQSMGIRLVPQHESSIPDLSVAENIFLGLWPKKANGVVNWDEMYKVARKELLQYGLDVDPKTKIRELSSVDTRKVNIIRAMFGGAALIILDEPTTALTDRERADLFGFIRKLRDTGTAFIFITHYLNEVMELSDDITVIRDGKAYEGKPEGVTVTEEYLSSLVAGETVKLTHRELIKDFTQREKVVECKNIVAQDVDGISFDIYKGEILGIVGFPGSGAREMCRALYGLNRIAEGDVLMHGEKKRIRSPEEALKQRIAYISHDRHREGLTPQFTINYNIGLTIMKTVLKKPMGFIDKRKEREISSYYVEGLKVKCNSIDDLISSLSGGNQQKVVVGKYLATTPEVLILDEPTIGIDIKSREEIIGTIDQMTKENVSVLYLTNDFEELLRVADRLLFFRDNKIVGEVMNENLAIEDITHIRDNVTM